MVMNDITTNSKLADNLLREYFEKVKGHDYSHMMSDDMRYWEAGIKSEKRIMEIIKLLTLEHGVSRQDLMNQTLTEVPQQYNDVNDEGDDLTHRVIKCWFN